MPRLELSEGLTELHRSAVAQDLVMQQRMTQLEQQIQLVAQSRQELWNHTFEAIAVDHPQVQKGCRFEGPAPERGKGRSAIVWPDKAAKPVPPTKDELETVETLKTPESREQSPRAGSPGIIPRDKAKATTLPPITPMPTTSATTKTRPGKVARRKA